MPINSVLFWSLGQAFVSFLIIPLTDPTHINYCPFLGLMSSKQHLDALGGKIPDIEWLESKIGPGEEINARNCIESVSRVAIRNIKPAQLDVNDPDQKKLVEKLNQTEGIFEYYLKGRK
jgi:hypothetical protein